MRCLERLARGGVAALTVLVLAACSGNGSTVCVSPTPPPSPPAAQIPTLVSPASGATGVSTGPLDITIGNAVDAMGMYLQNGSNFVTVTNFRQANPPSNDVRVGTVAQLASQTTYQVYAQVRATDSGPISDPCRPTPQFIILSRPQLIGSFTTR